MTDVKSASQQQPMKKEVKSTETSLKQFIHAMEKKTTDTFHHRLLQACLNKDPQSSLETELNSILEEVIHED